MNVRISRKSRMLINNKVLAAQVVRSIIDNKSELERGQVVSVGGSIGIKSVTSIVDNRDKVAK